MKKILIILTVLVLGLIAIFYNNYDNNKVVLTNNSNQKIINSNTLTMMYETDYDSGEYQVSNDSAWPGDEYIFNETLSKCENGGILNWNNENKKVLLQTNTSDRCYVYFDKYIMPKVISVETTEVTLDSVTVSVTASGGAGDIVSYYYSINNGEYISSSSNSYTFTGLTSGSIYNIIIYVMDNNGRYSNTYNFEISTSKNIITFSIASSREVLGTYNAEEGMTWEDFVNSDYNSGDFYINGNKLLFERYVFVLSCESEIISDVIVNGTTYSVDDSC